MLRTVMQGIIRNTGVMVDFYGTQKKRSYQFLLKDEQYDKKKSFLNLSDIKK